MMQNDTRCLVQEQAALGRIVAVDVQVLQSTGCASQDRNPLTCFWLASLCSWRGCAGTTPTCRGTTPSCGSPTSPSRATSPTSARCGAACAAGTYCFQQGDEAGRRATQRLLNLAEPGLSRCSCKRSLGRFQTNSTWIKTLHDHTCNIGEFCSQTPRWRADQARAWCSRCGAMGGCPSSPTAPTGGTSTPSPRPARCSMPRAREPKSFRGAMWV